MLVSRKNWSDIEFFPGNLEYVVHSDGLTHESAEAAAFLVGHLERDNEYLAFMPLEILGKLQCQGAVGYIDKLSQCIHGNLVLAILIITLNRIMHRKNKCSL
jgi:hypothetical protein